MSGGVAKQVENQRWLFAQARRRCTFGKGATSAALGTSSGQDGWKSCLSS